MRGNLPRPLQKRLVSRHEHASFCGMPVRKNRALNQEFPGSMMLRENRHYPIILSPGKDPLDAPRGKGSNIGEDDRQGNHAR